MQITSQAVTHPPSTASNDTDLPEGWAATLGVRECVSVKRRIPPDIQDTREALADKM